MAIIVCRGCGERHDALARCPVPITSGPPSEARESALLAMDQLSKAGDPIGAMTVGIRAGLFGADVMPKKARQKSLPKVDEVSTLPKPQSKNTRLAKAREVLEGDCSNPACPYRPEVMRMREQNRKRNEKWRMKQGPKPQ